MSNPEISRRCSSCGATVRQRAAFCPQCGNVVEDKADSFDPNETIAESPEPPKFDPSVTQPLKLAIDEKAQTQTLSARPVKKPVAAAGSKVGKLKKVSSVVLDQAAYDPSVRFLLVAAGLFLVFVVLLILSKVLG